MFRKWLLLQWAVCHGSLRIKPSIKLPCNQFVSNIPQKITISSNYLGNPIRWFEIGDNAKCSTNSHCLQTWLNMISKLTAGWIGALLGTQSNFSFVLRKWRSEKFRNFQENIRSGLLIDNCIPIFSVLNFGKFSRTSIIPLHEEVLVTEHLVVGSGTYSRPCQLMMELFYEK